MMMTFLGLNVHDNCMCFISLVTVTFCIVFYCYAVLYLSLEPVGGKKKSARSAEILWGFPPHWSGPLGGESLPVVLTSGAVGAKNP